MFLLVGLGNPGTKYSGNRHNVGFMALDMLAPRASWRSKFHSQITTETIDDHDCILLKPETYMNESGRALQAAMTFYKLKPEQIVVIHDDLDLPFAKLRIKQGGGHGGHNGLRSIDAAIGKNYWRVRFGIDHPRDILQALGAPAGTPADVSHHVLSDFNAPQRDVLPECLKALAQSLPLLLNSSDTQGATKAMRTYREMVKDVDVPRVKE